MMAPQTGSLELRGPMLTLTGVKFDVDKVSWMFGLPLLM